MKQIKLNSEQIKQTKAILKNYRNGVEYDEDNDCFDKVDLEKSVVETTPYNSFSNSRTKDAYKLAKILDVSVCPYCNENYTYTMKSGFRPEFDHFLPKSKYPALQLSLYNLVPSCHTCNSTLKGQKDFRQEPHLNPYKMDFDSIVRFAINIKDTNYLNEDNFEICFAYKDMDFPDNESAKNNIKDFKLKERYQFHKDEVVKLAKAAKYYTSYKKKEINELLSEPGLPLVSILFPDKDCEINKTSLGKLKRDISNFFLEKENLLTNNC